MSLTKRISAGEFAVLAEMNTPKGVNISEMVTNARRIKGRVDAAVLPDMECGVMRMSALGGAVILQQLGMEAVIHLYCRDRNRMALQGDILAAHVLGVQNLIVVNSEEIAKSDHPDAKAVHDLDEMGLLKTIQRLQKGGDLSGFDLDGAPQFTVGCTFRLTEDDKTLSSELNLAAQKIEAGADFIVTTPVYDVERFQPLGEKLKQLKVPIIASVFLIKSVAIARYLATYEPGAYISEDLIRRIRKAPNTEKECLRVAGETIRSLKDRVQGVQIITLGWEHRLAEILDIAGI